MKRRLLHFLAGPDPVLIVGCHRSGTTFLAELCSSAGLFLGSDLFEQHESNRFMQLHDRLLALAGSRWNQPGPFLDRMADDPAFADSVEREIVDSMLTREFFHRFRGYGNCLAMWVTGRGRRPWGWKDPRTSLLVARYIAVFPGCSVLHICRNGVDVAASLVQRDLTEEGRDGSAEDEPERLDRAFDLWQLHEESILDAIEQTGHSRYLRIRFEDLVLGEGGAAGDLDGFLAELGLTSPGTANHRPDMAWKFADSEKLVDFHLRRRDDGPMQTYGYGDIPRR